MRIGLFDSGLGGLTVLKELKNKHPNNEYIYFGDNKNLPYGSKTKEELFILSSNAVEFLISKNVDIIIIACGTVSSTVYDDLKQKYNIPIYDIITPTINYINDSNFKTVGLIATQATVSSNKFNKINKHFYQQACPLLVPFIEGDKTIDIDNALNEYLKEIKEYDAIILGCTHYPILENKIKNITKANLINMGTILAATLDIKPSIKKTNLYFSKLENNLIEKVNNIIEIECEIEGI